VAKGGLDLGKLEDEAEKEGRSRKPATFKDLTDRSRRRSASG
jgi:hypothetical protein